MTPEFVENIVIGSGPGGAVTALTLAEAGKKVLILEEGKKLGIDSCPQFTIEEMQTKYRNSGMTVSLGKYKVSYVEAKTVGGGSEVNSGLYHRTPDEVLEKWAKRYSLKNASPAEMLPHFEFSEKELSVSLSENIPRASKKLHEGALRLGWKSMEVPRWRKGTRRQSMTETLIPKALALGVRLADNTKVLNFKKTPDGFWQINCRSVVYQCKNLFVCGGAIQTPSLLLKSGIKKNVGRQLQMHPSFKWIAQFNEQVNEKDMGVPVHQVKEFSPDLSFGCSISSEAYLAMGLAGQRSEIEKLDKNWRSMAIYYAMVSSAESVGRIVNAPFGWDPFVFYHLERKDLETLADGIVRLAEALFAAGATRLISSIGAFTSLAEIKKEFVLSKMKSNGRLMTIHLFSSCPMGEDPSVAALNSYGQVYGQDRLFVNDGSMLCSSPGVNPQGSIMAFARRNTLHNLKLLG